MKKEKYIIPEMEVVVFETEDIITTSGGNTMEIIDTNGEPITIEVN